MVVFLYTVKSSYMVHSHKVIFPFSDGTVQSTHSNISTSSGNELIDSVGVSLNADGNTDIALL